MNKFPILTYLAQVQNTNLFPTKKALVLPLGFALMARHFLPTKNMIKPMLSRKDVAILGIVHAVVMLERNKNMVASLKDVENLLNRMKARKYVSRYISSQSPVKGGK